jgi:hypothetical protein
VGDPLFMADQEERSENYPPSDYRDEGRKRKRPQPGYFGLINDDLDLNVQNTYAPASPLASPIPYSLFPASQLPSSPASTAIVVEGTTERERSE